MRLDGSRANKRLSMVVNSIIRRSFRRSSLGLHRKAYFCPSDPTIVSFFGFCSDASTVTSSSILAIVATSWLNADHSTTDGTRCLLAALRMVGGGRLGVSATCPGTIT